MVDFSVSISFKIKTNSRLKHRILSIVLWCFFSLYSFFFFKSICRSTHGVFVYTERKRFLLYMLYAWGVSLFLTFVVFIVDITPIFKSSDLRPSIGDPTCFLKRNTSKNTHAIQYKTKIMAFMFISFVGTLLSQFIYFYLPLFIICTVNLTFFILTAMRILRAQQDLKKATSNEESTRHRNKLNSNKDR